MREKMCVGGAKMVQGNAVAVYVIVFMAAKDPTGVARQDGGDGGDGGGDAEVFDMVSCGCRRLEGGGGISITFSCRKLIQSGRDRKKERERESKEPKHVKVEGPLQ